MSLLLAGAGVALKAATALPKVASLINTVKNSALVTRTIAVGKSIGSALKTAANLAWKGIKTAANYAWTVTKNAVGKAYNAFTNFGPVKWLTNTKPWIYSKNALHKALKAVKDAGKYVWEKAKDFRAKVFGSSNLSLGTYSNLKMAGKPDQSVNHRMRTIDYTFH